VERSRTMIAFSSGIGILAGLCSTALIGVINAALAGANSSRTLLIFATLCLLIPVSGIIAKTLMVRLTSQTIHDLQIKLCAQILNAPYRLLEEIGPARLLATITEDIPAVTNAIANLPLLITQLAIMASCLLYLGWLYWPLLLVIATYMVVGIMSYQFPLRNSIKYFRLARNARDVFFKATRSLIEGNKELKLNREFRNAFLAQEVGPALKELKRTSDRGTVLAIAAAEWGQILFFIFIGTVVFLAPHVAAINRQALTGYTLTVLFMASPLITILNAAPIFGRAGIASEKIEALGLSLVKYPSGSAAPAPGAGSWNRLDLRGITHVYRQEGCVDEFCLGPLNITFSPGELVFLIGGNGSGKSTLAKILMGLYEPMDGQIAIDGEPITADNRDDYRQRFSVVFYDFYLFDRVHDVDNSSMGPRVSRYLEQLHLDNKVAIRDGKLSTLDLSQGQRKRLALLAAFIQDRPIYIFDEWASDQDPIFKQVFYRQILPELKSRGKTVIVISHDDRYYDAADRIIKLESGQLESDRYIKTSAALPVA
jgi:putative pyoverdin transport system ATP-binding/permease protein